MNTVSVVIPTYNRINVISRAIDSVLKQTHPINQIIVVDNNSTDNTSEILKNKYSKIEILVEQKQGVSFARNKGIKYSNCDWIALLDSDDSWKPQKIEKQLSLYEKSKKKLRVIHTDEIWYKNNKLFNQKKIHQKSGGDIFEKCLDLCCISPSSALLRSDLFKDIGYFDESFLACEDYDFWLRVTAREKVLFLDEPLTIKYGGHDDQLSKKYWGMDRFRVKALEKLILNHELNSKQKKVALKSLTSRLEIIVNGAKKRNNQNIEKIFQKKLNDWKLYIMENKQIEVFK